MDLTYEELKRRHIIPGIMPIKNLDLTYEELKQGGDTLGFWSRFYLDLTYEELKLILASSSTWTGYTIWILPMRN
ncbi:hypothetical protein CathTA2_0076 [Caldalkalibacillus thermarum TA2.A1]|uniref:Uncharacterized protein n=1 Tax=Caldalkalibacillus thermarum (strain TA2.A1) TaxID=986075 RepID=F5LB88_CALTT|nr:hypothetical protein CathTA2_0076 [Caldalkalibacillus thermarum TA2.A1]